MNTPRPNKYFAKKVHINGETFDSKWEHRYSLQLQADPRVEKVERQVWFVLQDGFRNNRGKWILPIKYKADFVVKYHGDPNTYVIDTKSPATMTDEYKIKAKMFQRRYSDLVFLEVMDDGPKAKGKRKPVQSGDRVGDTQLPADQERPRRAPRKPRRAVN